MNPRNHGTRAAIFLVLIGLLLPLPCLGKVRPAAWAGRFYPGASSDLSAMLRDLTVAAQKTPVHLPENPGNLRAVILPHAGYVYSGLTAAHGVFVLQKQAFKNVVLMGPDHRVGFAGFSVSRAEAYETPLGTIPVSSTAQTLFNFPGLFIHNESSDRQEHCLEVVLPFLQHFLGEFELIPIVTGRIKEIEPYARAIGGVLDKDTLLAVSSDLSHYLPYDQAKAKDTRTLQAILRLDESALVKEDNIACGIIPILVAVRLARTHGWEPHLLHYSNSGDTAGDKNRVVGYGAIAFFERKIMSSSSPTIEVTEKQGRTLVDLARFTIAKRLNKARSMPNDLEQALKDPFFEKKRAVFVTLTKKGQLRGCIGSLMPHDTLKNGVISNAKNAAFRDPRFSAGGAVGTGGSPCGSEHSDPSQASGI